MEKAITEKQWRLAIHFPKDEAWSLIKGDDSIYIHPLLRSQVMRVIISAFAKFIDWLLTTPPSKPKAISKQATPESSKTKTLITSPLPPSLSAAAAAKSDAEKAKLIKTSPQNLFQFDQPFSVMHAAAAAARRRPSRSRSKTKKPPSTLAETSTPPTKAIEKDLPETAAAAAAATQAMSASDVGDTPPMELLRIHPTHGLPNFRGCLRSVCYINVIIQMIANIPCFESLIQSVDVKNKPQNTKDLHRLLLAVISEIQKPDENREDILEKATAFWLKFQECLTKRPMGDLEGGVDKNNCSIEFLAFLGREFGIDIISQDSAILAGQALFLAQATGTAVIERDLGQVFVAPVDAAGSIIRESITINGHRYNLCGKIHYSGGHYTISMKTQSGDAFHINDESVVEGGDPGPRYWTRGVVYQKVS